MDTQIGRNVFVTAKYQAHGDISVDDVQQIA